MPMLKLDSQQFVAAIEERLSVANPSVVLANVADAFRRYTDMFHDRADMMPDLTATIAGHLREMADTARAYESGEASLKRPSANRARAYKAKSRAAKTRGVRVGAVGSLQCTCGHHELAHLIGVGGPGTGKCPVDGCNCSAFAGE